MTAPGLPQVLHTGAISPGTAGEGVEREKEFEPLTHPQSIKSTHEVPDLPHTPHLQQYKVQAGLCSRKEREALVLSLQEQAGVV